MDKCYFCDSSITAVSDTQRPEPRHIRKTTYNCQICGLIWLEDDFVEFTRLERSPSFSSKDKEIIRICLRNEHESRGRIPPARPLTLEQLSLMVRHYRELDPLEKMDKALEIIDKRSQYIGDPQRINPDLDFSLFHCSASKELRTILGYLLESGLTKAPEPADPKHDLSITPKGYERLRELKRSGKDSRQCFVAMWFSTEMENVYENAIRPAIEYIEEGQSEPRFKPLKIDQIDDLR